VRVLIAVKQNLELINAPLAGEVNRNHRVLVRIRIIVRLLLLGVARQRDWEAFFDQRDGLLALRGGDQIDRAQLIFFPPPSPVGQFGHQTINVRFRHFAL